MTVSQIAKENGLTVQQTKTALDRLKATNKITIKSTNKYSIITLLEYDGAFSDNKQNNNQITNEQQTNNKPTLYNTEEQNIRITDTALARGGESELSENEISFEKFWSAYPKKTAKQNAFKIWQKLKPDEELVNKILSALERFKRTEQWQRDDGRFIPYPASFLNDRRWEDETAEHTQPQSISSFGYNKRSSFDIDDVMSQIQERYRKGG